jgi:transposase, IS30 family
MIKLGRPGLSGSQRNELWRRWKVGQSMQEISQALQLGRVGVWWHLQQSGGLVPRVRRRASMALTMADRLRARLGWQPGVMNEAGIRPK